MVQQNLHVLSAMDVAKLKKCCKKHCRKCYQLWKHLYKIQSFVLNYVLIQQRLRRNPPDAGVTSGQKPCTKIIYMYIVLQTSVRLFKLSSQNNSFIATPNVKNKCWTSYETLKSSGEMKLMMKFCLCFHKITELWNLFSLVPMGNYFSVLFQAIFYVFRFKKM